MTEVQIVYWRSIPSLVAAREGRRARYSVELGARFQIAIDELAMRIGVTGTDAYLDGWERTPWESHGEPVEAAAELVAGELERAYPPERVRALIDEAVAAAQSEADGEGSRV